MFQPIRGQGGHLVFCDSPKNTNLVEDVEILLPVKSLWILFSGFKEVENGSAVQWRGRPSCFSDRPEKNKLGRGRWDFASCQVSLNYVLRCQRRSGKCDKLTTYRRRTDGRLTTHDHRMSLRLRCTKRGAFDTHSHFVTLVVPLVLLRTLISIWIKKYFQTEQKINITNIILQI